MFYLKSGNASGTFSSTACLTGKVTLHIKILKTCKEQMQYDDYCCTMYESKPTNSMEQLKSGLLHQVQHEKAFLHINVSVLYV